MNFNSIDDLKDGGFTGFVSIGQLMEKRGTAIIDKEKGVYLILHTRKEYPKFLDPGTEGHFKGADPNEPIETLEKKWCGRRDLRPDLSRWSRKKSQESKNRLKPFSIFYIII